MATNKMVIVPQDYLDNLEEARKRLYAMYPSNIADISTPKLMELSVITQPMWILANTKWEEFKP